MICARWSASSANGRLPRCTFRTATVADIPAIRELIGSRCGCFRWSTRLPNVRLLSRPLHRGYAPRCRRDVPRGVLGGVGDSLGAAAGASGGRFTVAIIRSRRANLNCSTRPSAAKIRAIFVHPDSARQITGEYASLAVRGCCTGRWASGASNGQHACRDLVVPPEGLS